MFAWLFKRRPGFALYCDYGKDALFSCRLVRKDDEGIDLGAPRGIFMLPIRSRFDSYTAAVRRMAEKLDALNIDCGKAQVFSEQAHRDGEGKPTAGKPLFRGTVKEVLAR